MKAIVLYINHVSQIGGAETSLIDIFDNIDRKKYQVILACPAAGDLVDEVKKRDAEYVAIKIGALKRTFNPLLWIIFLYSFLVSTIKLTYIIKSQKVKIIHANSFTSSLFCSISARLCSVPLIWHMRDMVKIRLFNKIFIYSAGMMANRVIATTAIMKNNLISLGVEAKKICVINNGIDQKKYDSSNVKEKNIRKEFGLSLETPLIGIIGQLTPWKGHRDFIHAFSIVAERYPTAKFLIVGKTIIGDSHYREQLESLVEELRLDGKIIFAGYRKDISDVIASLDILVSASWEEPFGRTIIEGMAAGKPVIATNAGGVPDIIENGVNGLLVSPRNPQKMAEGVLKILNDNDLAEKLGNSGRKTVKQRFSLEEQIRKIEKIYEEVL